MPRERPERAGPMTLFQHYSASRAFCFSRLGEVGIIAWKDGVVSEDAFLEHCWVVAEATERHGPARVFFNWSPYFNPTSAQRTMIAEHQRAMGIPELLRLAVVSESALVRGVVTALRWVVPGLRNTKSFAIAERDEAVSWLREKCAFDEAAVQAEIDASIAFVQENQAVTGTMR